MRKLLITVCAVGLLVGCGASNPSLKVYASKDPGVDFRAVKTFAWLGSIGVVQDPDGRWAPPDLDVAAELKWLIGRELRERGLTVVEDHPDALVAFAVVVDAAHPPQEQVNRDKLDQKPQLSKGALLIELIDPTTNRALWSGSATSDIRNKPERETLRKGLDNAVNEIFSRYPKK